MSVVDATLLFVAERSIGIGSELLLCRIGMGGGCDRPRGAWEDLSRSNCVFSAPAVASCRRGGGIGGFGEATAFGSGSLDETGWTAFTFSGSFGALTDVSLAATVEGDGALSLSN